MIGTIRAILLLFLVGLAAPAPASPLDEIRCELGLARISGEREARYSQQTAQVRQILEAQTVPGYLTRFRSHYVDRVLPVLVPVGPRVPELETLLDHTLGIVWRDTTGVGEIFGHSYVRVGRRIYDLQIAGVVATDFVEMMEKRFHHQFGMRDRPGRTPYYEALFPIGETAKAELIRFFEDRAAGRATIDGQRMTTYWETGARGYFDGEGRLRENCGAFASSFAHPHWWGDYPGLREAVRDTGLVQPNQGANAALRYLFDPEAHTLGLVVWDVHHGDLHLWERHRILDTTQWPYETSAP